ncbi:MAG: alcohol dehydrogenase catalytic domain-containing protein [Ignavibacteriaceae bacterium]|jgi:threonine dehydrogenase-like Zn-dependent dehydrogenase
MKKMKTLVYKGIGQITLEERSVPIVTEPFDVVLKVSACGICGTDVKIMEGKHVVGNDIALGHEFCGVVQEIGSHVTTLKIGDRVAVDNSLRCGLCEYCRTGNSPQCEWLKDKSIGVFQNGGYAEYCLLPENACFKIPDAMDDITATQVETLGTVLNGMNAVQMQCWDTVVVLGFGPIGYLFSALSKNVAAYTMCTEIDPFRIGVAKKLGLSVFNPNEVDIEKEVMKFTDGKGADIVIDAVGSQLENALKYVTPGGKVLAFGMDSSIKATIVPNTITRKAIKLIGTYIGQNTLLPAIKILMSGKINMEPFFTEVIPLENGISSFDKLGLDLETMKHIPKQAMKIVIKP